MLSLPAVVRVGGGGFTSSLIVRAKFGWRGMPTMASTCFVGSSRISATASSPPSSLLAQTYPARAPIASTAKSKDAPVMNASNTATPHSAISSWNACAISHSCHGGSFCPRIWLAKSFVFGSPSGTCFGGAAVSEPSFSPCTNAVVIVAFADTEFLRELCHWA